MEYEVGHPTQDIWDQQRCWEAIQGRSGTLLDLGSHVGLSLLYFAEHSNMDHMVAVEPDPTNLEFLHKNALLSLGFHVCRPIKFTSSYHKASTICYSR